MNFEFPDFRILLFAREPVPGRVKTRLHPVLGKRRAFALYCALLRYQVAMLENNCLAPWELWVSGNRDNPVLHGLGHDHRTFEQAGSDLGKRMRAAAATALKQSSAVVLVGTDCPSIDHAYLRDAMVRLQSGAEVVLGPAEDGGYVLLGITGSWTELFDGVPWGTGQVLEETVMRARQLQLKTSLLSTRWDVDRPEDLARLAELEPAFEFQTDGSERAP